MTYSYYKTIIPLVALCAQLVHSQDSSNNVIGCPELDCPKTTCTIANATFAGLGAAPLVASSSANTSSLLPSNLSWLQASGVDNPQATNGTFTDYFYLATPNNNSSVLNNTCAVFFRHINATFPNPNLPEATGTCPDALHQDCLTALQKRATSLTLTNGGDGTDLCGQLQQAFTDTFDDECAPYLPNDNKNNKKWPSVTATSLADKKPLSTDQNATSDCWPVQPKSDDLTLVATFEEFGEFRADTEPTKVYELTPILTVAYGGGEDGSSSEAQFTCLKVVQPSVGDVYNPPSAKGGAAGTVFRDGNKGGFVVAVFASVLVAMLLL